MILRLSIFFYKAGKVYFLMLLPFKSLNGIFDLLPLCFRFRHHVFDFDFIYYFHNRPLRTL